MCVGKHSNGKPMNKHEHKTSRKYSFYWESSSIRINKFKLCTNAHKISIDKCSWEKTASFASFYFARTLAESTYRFILSLNDSKNCFIIFLWCEYFKRHAWIAFSLFQLSDLFSLFLCFICILFYFFYFHVFISLIFCIALWQLVLNRIL